MKLKQVSGAELVVVFVNAAYLLAGLIFALAYGNSEFLLYAGIIFVLMIAIAAFHFKVRLPIWALWGLTAWGIAHLAGGLVPVPESWPTGGEVKVLYNLWLVPEYLKYDNIVHAYGFGLVTAISWIALKVAFKNRGLTVQPSFGLIVLCMASGLGFGAVNEVLEFAATLLIPDTNVGGYVNTGWDLVSNLVGSSVAAVLIVILDGRKANHS